MSNQYKVCPMFWEYRGGCYHLRNRLELEKLLNDGWEILRCDIMQPTNYNSDTSSTTSIYILRKQSEDANEHRRGGSTAFRSDERLHP